MNIKTAFSQILIIACLFVTSDVSAQQTKMIDRVKTVINEGVMSSESETGIQLEYVRQIGGIDTYDNNLTFHYPKDMTIDSRGNIYILDTDNFRIQKLSPEGKFILKIGKRGKRKGQFFYPVSIDIDNEDNLIVYDMGSNRFDAYSTEGKYIRSYPIEILPNAFKINSEGKLIIPGGGYSGDPTVKIMKEMTLENDVDKAGLSLLKIVDPGTGAAKNIGNIPDYGNMKSNLLLNRVFFCQENNGNYLVGYHALNRIEKYDPNGEILLRIERPVNFEIKKPKYDHKNHILSMSRVMEGIGVDSKNRIWSATYNRKIKDAEDLSIMLSVNGDGLTEKFEVEANKNYYKTDMFILEVFDENGTLLKKFPLTHFADDMKIFGDRIFIIDRYREMAVFEYRIISD
ncbi:MAG: 6-bladed beta-propeller [bacterium]|nr:6-bladed beta-propeller [bacterium]